MIDTPSNIEFPPVGKKNLTAAFDGGDISSNAGLALLAQANRKTGVTAAIASAFTDRRQAGKVEHSLETLVEERVYSIAAGYEDANDLNDLRHDPLLKVSCGRTPSGRALAAQPTMSRFENDVSSQELVTAGEALARIVIAQFPAHTRYIVLDLDATDAPCYGQQEFQSFAGYYRTNCYVPLYLMMSGEDTQQQLLATMLRAGRSPNAGGACWLLRKAIPLIRERFPNAKIVLRADAGFGIAKIIRFCERQGIDYILSLRGNMALDRLCEAVQVEAALTYSFYNKWTDARCRAFGEFDYRAKTWPWSRRVIVRAELSDMRVKPRYVVTNLQGTPQYLYESVYSARGDCENLIKESKLDLKSGRMSCHRFWANQTRLLFHMAASVLYACIKKALVGTQFERAQIASIRNKLIKVGVRVVESVRRICMHLPTSFPEKQTWFTISHRLTQI